MNNLENQGGVNKNVINYYPGHMAKTKRLIKEKESLIDVVYELIDSRIPSSSKIKEMDDVLKNRPRILIMTKYDLCDKEETAKWIEYYQAKGFTVMPLDLTKTNDYQKLINKTNELMQNAQEKRLAKGLKKKEIRVLVVGVPNVGKSTLINRLAGKKVVNVGNMPGVTKNLSWLKTNSNILLLDSPGILWPKFETPEIALNLAAVGTIPQDVLPLDKVAVHILEKLNNYYPEILKTRYNLDNIDDIVETYTTIGRKIGAIISGGEIDYKRVSLTIINDVKNEYIKNITFDRI